MQGSRSPERGKRGKSRLPGLQPIAVAPGEHFPEMCPRKATAQLDTQSAHLLPPSPLQDGSCSAMHESGILEYLGFEPAAGVSSNFLLQTYPGCTDGQAASLS